MEKAAEIVEGLKSKETFDARAAINGTTYPTGTVRVYLNAALAHRMNLAADDLIKAEHLVDNLKAADSGIVGHPDLEPAEAEVARLKAEIDALGAQVLESALTFHIRGLAPAQWRLIYKKWRKEIKQPARKNFDQGPDGEEEYEGAVFERNIERNARINEDQVASAIIKVVNAAGVEDGRVWAQADTENFHDIVLESEWNKLKAEVENLTFAHTIFDSTVAQDADFLLKP